MFINTKKHRNSKYTQGIILTIYQTTKSLDLSEFTAFAGDKFNVTKIVISVFDRVENIVGKGDNAGYQHCLLFPQCFQKASSPVSVIPEIVW